MSDKLIQFGDQNRTHLMKDYEIFFQNSPISFFSYASYGTQEEEQHIRLKEDYFLVSTDSQWTDKRLTQNWSTPKAGKPISQALQLNRIYPYMISKADQGDDLMRAFYEHGYREGLTLYKWEGLKLHAFNFSVRRDVYLDNIYDFYLHELQNIWNFCLIFLSHFENHCKNTILPVAQNKLVKDVIIQFDKKLDLKNENKLLKKIKVFKDSTSIEITLHQFRLMEQISCGFSFKQIAHNLNISIRTVEANYNLLKKTLDLYSRDKISSLWRENNIF